MTVAVIVHVEADRPYVDSLQAKLDGVRLIACAVRPKTPVMAFDARLPLILVWSASAAAEAAERPFSSLGRVHLGQTIVCVIDSTPLPARLQRLQASVVDGSPRSSLFPGGLSAALTEARRRQLYVQAARPPAGVLTTPSPHLRRAFAEGVTRGLAGGVAVFGVGGAAALTVDQIPNGSPDMVVADMPERVPAPLAVDDASDWTASASIVIEAPQSETFAEAAYADDTSPELANVPLATPGPDEMAARRATAFITDTPLEVWTPDPGVVSPLYSIASGPPNLDLAPLPGDEFTGGGVPFAERSSGPTPGEGIVEGVAAPAL